MPYLTRAPHTPAATASECQAIMGEASACDVVQFMLARQYVAARRKHGADDPKTERLRVALAEVTSLGEYARIAWAEADETRDAVYKAAVEAAGGPEALAAATPHHHHPHSHPHSH